MEMAMISNKKLKTECDECNDLVIEYLVKIKGLSHEQALLFIKKNGDKVAISQVAQVA